MAERQTPRQGRLINGWAADDNRDGSATAGRGSVVFLLTDLIFGPAGSIPVTIIVLIVMSLTWFGLPLQRHIGGGTPARPTSQWPRSLIIRTGRRRSLR
ncbi:hypothetical protein [Mycolicibacterium arenosum]|jgi:hypothetical protein|uniref:Uncharacterized protein n=1 Tax=Mycolicibacterium arenosum TaxID=2952157 RepID=A0ABT1MDT2_9MYCO|nr:hypothetical protein [Mycolicibacterium sp. CAU 1645]MCP9275937.1 hypothetical protein [Mycolicibacterium sp. CAU 1645]